MELLGVFLADLPSPLHWLRPGLPLYLMLGVVGLVGLFFLVLLVVCLCERQRLTGDVEPASEPFPYPPTPYWQATCADALKLGFQHDGDFATRRNTSAVKGLMSLFISQDRRVIGSVISGSFAGAKDNKTLLRSRSSSGRVLESCDQGGMEDLSGLVDRAILFNAGIAELMEFHLHRINNSGLAAIPFKSGSVLQELEKLELERGERWVLLGLARWADPQQTSIRMTFRGALAMMKKVARQTSKVSGQQHRVDILRAGSRLGD